MPANAHAYRLCMRCGQCGHPNPDGSRFCGGCGGALGQVALSPLPPPMTGTTQPQGASVEPRWAESLAMAAVCALIGFIAFVADRPVPLLRFVDLGIHELGHRLFFWEPDVVGAMMGNGVQTAVPLCLVVYFACRRDWVGAGFCLAWTGETLWYAAVYIADAPDQNLPLLHPGDIHDWAFILGPDHFNDLDQAASIAHWVHGCGIAFTLLGLASCLAPPLYLERRRRDRREQAG